MSSPTVKTVIIKPIRAGLDIVVIVAIMAKAMEQK